MPMISAPDFVEGVRIGTSRDIVSDKEQYEIVMSESNRSIKVVAGPGSGKTTVIVLRIMKSIFVDGIAPAEIMATTFTVKAAAELKSRILNWGENLRQHFTSSGNVDDKTKSKIHKLNFDSITVGTLDSIAQETMTDFRLPGQTPPIIIDEFIQRSVMLGQWFAHRSKESEIAAEYISFMRSADGFKSVSEKVEFLIKFRSRMKENKIPIEKIESVLPCFSGILNDYDSRLKEKLWMDFPMLEQEFSKFIEDSRAAPFISKIKFLMVDEYQDTNLMQEEIYLKLGEAVVACGGSIIVVGDDDQSIYRFRGSRVFLFTDLEERAKTHGIEFATFFLTSNYRSTENIVSFCNEFVTIDSKYQEVRARDKPDMKVMRKEYENNPIFGIFRETPEELAHDLSNFVESYVGNGQYVFHGVTESWTLEKSDKGTAADIVLLCSSSAEFSSGGNPRLPHLIREDLRNSNSTVKVYNPRGVEIRNVDNVKLLCGTLLECLDPNEALLQNEEKKVCSANTKKIIEKWRDEARSFIDDSSDRNHKLKDYVDSWREGKPYPKKGKWDKKEVALLDIVYNILYWIPEMNNDAEGLFYLEAICRAVNQSILISSSDSKVKFDERNHPEEKSVRALYRDIVVPLAEGIIDTNEDLLFTLPIEDRLSIMSIHQAKGLEFPITIVDVSSDFKTNHAKQKFKRYPVLADETALIENFLRGFTDDEWSLRDNLDSVFDDLIRKYYVAFSRSQDVLILVGLTSSINSDKIKNVATGWDRDGNWHWKRLANLKLLR